MPGWTSVKIGDIFVMFPSRGKTFGIGQSTAACEAFPGYSIPDRTTAELLDRKDVDGLLLRDPIWLRGGSCYLPSDRSIKPGPCPESSVWCVKA